MMVKRNVTKNRLDPEQTLKYVQKSGGEIIAKKGATFYAVSASVKPLMCTDFACVSYGIVILKPFSTSKSLLSSVPTSPRCSLTALAIANMSRVNWELAKVNSYALSVSMNASG